MKKYNTFFANKFTCAGAPTNPTPIPATTLPINSKACDWAVANVVQPARIGIDAISSAVLRPTVSAAQPDTKEPKGVARLWMLAEIKIKIQDQKKE